MEGNSTLLHSKAVGFFHTKCIKKIKNNQVRIVRLGNLKKWELLLCKEPLKLTPLDSSRLASSDLVVVTVSGSWPDVQVGIFTGAGKPDVRQTKQWKTFCQRVNTHWCLCICIFVGQVEETIAGSGRSEIQGRSPCASPTSVCPGPLRICCRTWVPPAHTR